MPALTWKDASEIAAGMLIDNRLAITAVKANTLMPPYDRLAELIQKSRKKVTFEKIIETIGLAAVDAAMQAAQRTKQLPADWAVVLERSARQYDLGRKMERAAAKMIAGEVQELDFLKKYLDTGDVATDFGMVRLDTVDIPKGWSPFIPSGYQPVDHYFGGLPDSGLVIVAAPPGTGKTFLALKLMESQAKLGNDSCFFSIEQNQIQVAHRCRAVMKMPKAVQHHILICDQQVSVNDVARIADDLDEEVKLVIIDFAELLVEGDDAMSSEQMMTYIYRTLAKLAKRRGIVVIILAQFNRANYQTMGLSGIRYSGAAEQMAAMVVFIYNISQVFMGTTFANGALHLDPGNAALIQAKSRHGYKFGQPIAVEIPFGERGWGEKGIRMLYLANDAAPSPAK